MLDLIIFSRNRSLQLYALLESIGKYFDPDAARLTILHRYDGDHCTALKEVKAKFSSHEFVDELNFRDHVQGFLARPGQLIAFLTDDIIFKETVDVNQLSQLMFANPSVLAFSLRLGLHISKCYALGREQQLPAGNVHPPNIFIWDWRTAQMDWEYAFSVDGHVFRKAQLSAWANRLEYHHPNSFEEQLQACREIPGVPSIMACHVISRLVNLPINRVQSTHHNRCGNVTSDFLLQQWNEGLCLDIKNYHQVLNRGVHEELELIFKER
ncbi:MAG TPA: hypothetical protein EYG51_03515 [Pseudomonadales bacterium]|nr:hypothetical protein [Pseudomonadales bacterium]